MKRCLVACVCSFLACTAPAVGAPGDLDPSFSGDGFDTQDVFNDDCGRDVAIQPDGKIVVVGACEGSAAATTFSVLRYLPDGNPDQDFGVDGVANVSFDGTNTPSNEYAEAVALQPDGKIVVAGTTDLGEAGTFGGGGENFAVARLEPDGDLDPTFHANGTGANQDGRLVANQADIDRGADVGLAGDGSIFVGGAANRNNSGDFAVMKLTPQGELDASYAGGGKARLSIGAGDELLAIAVQSDGKVVAAGYSGTVDFPTFDQRTVALARFTTGGQPDPSFDDDGSRTLDFGPGGEEAHGLAIDSAGRIVIGAVAAGGETGVARLLSGNGATDLTFGGDGRATVDTGAADAGYDVTTLADGRVVVGGDTGSGATPNNAYVALLREDGAPDSDFGNQPGHPGVAINEFGADEHLEAVVAQPDNRLVIAATAPGRDFLTARLLGPPLPPTGEPGPGPGSGPPPPPGPPPPDGTAPTVNSLIVTRAFAAASRGDAILTGRRAPIGGTVRYALSEPATTTFTVERATTGRKVGRRCVKPTKSNRKRRKCTRYVRLRGAFTHQGATGANSFKFSGRLNKRKLAPGTYRLVAVAADAAGNKSPARRKGFKIVRR